MLEAFLETHVLGNMIMDYAISLGVFVAGFAALWIFKNVIVRRLEAAAALTATTADDFIISIIDRKLPPILYYGVFYISLRGLQISMIVQQAAMVVGVALLTYVAIQVIIALIYHGLENYWLVRPEDMEKKQNVRSFVPVLKAIIWAAGAVFLLDNLGFKVSTLVAGLGIGGVAVAIAAQAVLGDLFAYFAILLDKPFEKDDFIVVDALSGTIEHVGIKTTRIRSLTGEQLVFSNSDLTGSRVKNFRRMEERRIVFTFGILYQTPQATVASIPGIVKGIIERTEGTRFDRTHFARFGDSGLEFEAAYFVLSPDYARYMDIQQAINLGIMEGFARRGIEFSYPTRTLYVHNVGRRPEDDIIGELDLGLND